MTLGQRIKQARKAKGLSLEQLGKLLGVTRQLVWQWERDDTDASKHIAQLCEHLTVPVEYFYGPSASDTLENKIRRLDPERQGHIEAMVNALLLLQQQEGPVKKVVK